MKDEMGNEEWGREKERVKDEGLKMDPALQHNYHKMGTQSVKRTF